ncbi:cation-translocating P-type ATPase [Caproiciproducens galactitolivorans]|uniref:Cation-translocating P-type ATPase n=1 Tax=Caproiciproducens galactitolivorans TaxID=642589 RepID=A0ABT4BT52_9FIRM|nr:cation-translocating P-type ATPase [Caproiciproducens galactitolivorans]MCY1714065.1 cation-translocating P-type ATPase [Caproiciproducens galactitolivorans]
MILDEICSKGLTQEQVESRRQRGLVNGTDEIKTKSIGQIVLGNVVTPFNILNVILASLIVMVGSYKNLLFMGVIICNALIGTIQEVRAKKTIDRLKLIAAPKAGVMRDGIKKELPVGDLVLDDILILTSGNQICADCVIVDGECEVNESLITGEQDAILKKENDHLLSGSFIASGSCCAKVEHIGSENYASKITKSAKYLKKPNSEIMNWVNKIIKYIGFSIIPIGILLFYKQYFFSGHPFQRAVVGTVAALIGMIPEGLVLLTSVVLAVSVIRLAHHKALVQELYSIETLARVDTLCLDKTGTITEGSMQVDAILPLCDITKEDTEDAIAALITAVNDENPTANAIKGLGLTPPSWDCTRAVAFSSARKWSGASFRDGGTYLLGAGEFILKDEFCKISSLVEEHSAMGQRVLLLAHSPNALEGNELPSDITPLALLLLSDKIRKNANRTLSFFADQGVDIKVISGDNAVTVANIAKKAGLKNADNVIDASLLLNNENLKAAAEKYTVFGRVTPQQKLDLVKALKEQGHTVAMTGDGVNDVLALKESDCSIAMASGSDASKTVSQVVLLDSDFASMPRIVNEGRRSINNLQRSASLFMVKAIFSAIIAVLFIFVSCGYPFQPIQFTLINAVSIGIPSFILALEQNRERIQGRFMVNVMKKSLPGALTMSTNILFLVLIACSLQFSPEQISTLAVILTGYTGLHTLFKVCIPFNVKHAVLFWLMAGIFIVAILFFKPFFGLVNLTLPMVLILVPLLLAATSLMSLYYHMIEKVIMKKAK